MRTNVDRLVMNSVWGEISHPEYERSPYYVSTHGQPTVVTGMSGITYNVRVGDSATRWVADHLEPAVSIKHPKGDGRTGPNAGLNVLACVGNQARVVSGDAKGKTGTVTGKHGGVEHVIVDFTPAIMEDLLLGDKVAIRAYGMGLSLEDYPEVKLFNISPDLLEAWKLEEHNGMLHVPVTHKVPAAVMGSGLGRDNVHKGDYDITMFDDEIVAEYQLDELRLGDIVAIMDTDHSFGCSYRKGAVSVGIVAHGHSVIAGHGPGVTSLMTSLAGEIKPVIDPGANIAVMMNLREDI